MGDSIELCFSEIAKKGKIRFTIPLIPPSVNVIYKKSRSGIVYKTGEAREYENKFLKCLAKKFPTNCIFESVPYEIRFIIYFSSVFSQEGNILKIDASNHIKLVEDCIEQFFGYDDKANFRVVIEKRQCKNIPRIVCELRKYSDKEIQKINCNCKKCRDYEKANQRK